MGIWIDRFIRRLEEGDRPSVTREESLRRMAEGLKALRGQEKPCRILLAGTAPFHEIQSLSTQLSLLLPQEWGCVCGGDVTRDAQTVRQMAACDAVILTEQKDRSLYPVIRQEIGMIRQFKKEILGFVLVR